MNFIEMCRKFISIDSTTHQGSSELVKFIAEVCRSNSHMVIEIQEDEPLGRDSNIIIRPTHSLPNKEIMYQTHLDTSDPGAFGLWNHTGSNPFNATLSEGRLFGLGACNAKLDFLCKWMAMEPYFDKKLSHPFVLVGTFGENQGRSGALRLMRKKRVRADRALIGEPTHLKLLNAGKGVGTVEILIPFSKEEIQFKKDHDDQEISMTRSKIFSGKPSPSYDTQHEDNAIRKMFDYLDQLPDGLIVMEMDGGVSPNSVPSYAILEFDIVGSMKETIGSKIKKIIKVIDEVERDFEKYSDLNFDPSISTLNFGMMRTHVDHIRLQGCFNFPPCITNDIYESWMQKLKKVCDHVGASFNIVDYKQPFLTSLDLNFTRGNQKILEEMHLDSNCKTTPNNNEAAIFSRFGIECLVFGPGEPIYAHTPEEHIHIEDLYKAIDFYKKSIQRFCL